MSRKVTPNDCKSIFSDRFASLSMKEIGIELKHYSVGTAPEHPSFLVNQDELRKVLIDKFSVFFDPENTQGLEILFLKSNYGNGKSHFIRSIHSFFAQFDNVITKNVSLKSEETDLKKKVLGAVNQRIILDFAKHYANNAKENALFDSNEGIIAALQEKYDITATVAKVIYAAAFGTTAEQIQAISILKNDYLSEHLKKLKITKSELNSEFYFSVIGLLSKYLSEKQIYIVIVFDEYEHVHSWKNSSAKAEIYQDLKAFYDGVGIYENLCFIFAESEAMSGDEETLDDPAFVTRKQNTTYRIKDITSNSDIENLFNCIISRYEKYYDIDFSLYRKELLEEIIASTSSSGQSNYRVYTAAIMKKLNEFRENPPKKKRVTKNNIETRPVSELWKESTSISRKTMICSALEHVLNHNNIYIIHASKKYGEYIVADDVFDLFIYIVATDNPGYKDFEKRIKKAREKAQAYDCDEIIILYPLSSGMFELKENETGYFYSHEQMITVLEKVMGNKDTDLSVDGFFSYFTSIGA